MMILESLIELIAMNNEFKVVIPGHNVQKYIKINVNRILSFLPYLKNHIVIFDDYSTDGTKEWAEENGYKVITWMYEDFNECKDNITAKVNSIYRDIMKQMTCKYLLFLDSDVVLKNPDFIIEGFYNLLFKNSKIHGILDRTTMFTYDCITDFIKENKLESFLENIRVIDYCPVFDAEAPMNNRMWFGLSLLNLSYFKEIGLYFDDIEDETLRNQYNYLLTGYFDSGSYFFSKIIERNIPYSENKEYWCHYVFHFGGRACYEYDKENNIWCKSYIEKNIEEIEDNPELRDYLISEGFDYTQL